MQNYKEIKKIGQGAMGSAHLVKRKSDGKKLVAKVINVDGLETKERAEAMQEVTVHQDLRCIPLLLVSLIRTALRLTSRQCVGSKQLGCNEACAGIRTSSPFTRHFSRTATCTS